MNTVIGILELSKLNPPAPFIDGLRFLNVVVGLVAFVALIAWSSYRHWPTWDVPTRLAVMALALACFTGFFGSLEIKYFDTYFRVPMVTVTLLWSIIAAFWPNEREHKPPKGT